ncbi:hypothetical protein OA92_04755 [Marinomonas sp. SBI22]|uniref:non-ribosomal peptide synthetase n=1 Tax=unclassified Marinomonas TaxID=196814 RepID=UPI0007AF0525|nr:MULTISPECIES: non-ribosomal peptide synthetase [unclassified Marinomonas]KZM45155.1 hypothetical protein OA92_04755 [Marinomonas sp. SBI22]KZM46853.1 hypothetical protein OA91_03810 [Marinomonas sp. SBI8L]
MPHKLISRAKSQGVYLYVENGSLKYKAEKGKLTKSLAAELKEQKQALIDFLESHKKPDLALEIQALNSNKAPLSFAQSRVYFLEKLACDSALYHMVAAFKVSGPLNIEWLEASIKQIMARHSILSTAIASIDKDIKQVICQNQVECPIKVEEKGDLTESDWLVKQANKPFDLSKPPLFRVSLLKLAPEETILTFVFHHLIFDGYSYSCFFSELNDIYRAYALNKPVSEVKLPSLKFQYADYAHWQESEQSKLSTKTLNYWKAKMSGVQSLNSLPTDYKRTNQTLSEGVLIEDQLDQAMTNQVKAFAQRQGVSLYTVLMSVYSVLVGRWLENEDVVIGTPVSGRDISGVSDLIGFFANTLILRNQIAADKSFSEILETTKQGLAEAFQHQAMPFEKIVDQIGLERSELHAPILQLLFVLNQTDKASLALDSANVTKLLVDRKRINFELELHVTDKGDCLELYWLYAKALFKETSIIAFKQSYKTLLEQLILAPNKSIASFSLISQTDLKQIQAWNNTQQNFHPNLSFIERFEKNVSQNPDKLACVWYLEGKKQTLSYAELNKKANRIAHYLISKVAKRDVCIAMGYSWHIDAIISILAILKSGAAYVPIDTEQPEQRLKGMLENASIKLMLGPDRAKAGMQSLNVMDISSHTAEDILANFPNTNPTSKSHASDLAYVIFTSGSTGQPKGVMLEHASLNNFMDAMQERVNYQTHDIVACMTSTRFDIHITEILMPLVSSASISLLSWDQARSPKTILNRVKQDNISLMQATPSVWQLLYDEGFRPNSDFKMITGGDHLPESLKQALLNSHPEAKLFNLYAPSEATVYCSGNQVSLNQDKVNIGKPFANNRYYILDENEHQLPIGCIGELYISGKNLARGYLANDELTRQCFKPDIFCDDAGERMYQTGDLARRLEDGSVELISRKDFQLKLNGIRIEAGEIEHHLLQINSIDNALVTIKEIKPDYQALVAYLIPKSGELLDLVEIRRYLTRHLPSSFVPSYFVELWAFPLTQNLKVDRLALPLPDIDKAGAENTDQTLVLHANTNRETWLAALWEEMLSIAKLDINKNFFSLGGHSLLAIKMVNRISDKVGYEVSLRSLIQAGTVYELAKLIDELSDKLSGDNDTNIIPKTTPVQLSEKQESPLSFSQLRLWTLDQIETKGKHYCVPFKFEIKGELSLKALSESLLALIKRHQILTTSYHSEQEKVYQRVVKHESVNSNLVKQLLDYQDVTKARDLDDLVSHFESNIFERPFDLAKGDVFRVGLAKVADNKYHLYVGVHHIAIDGESSDILLNEIQNAYNASVSGKDYQPKPLAFQYKDYAAWQRNEHETNPSSKQQDYWQTRLAEYQPKTFLNTDLKRPEVSSYQGENVSTALDESTSHHLLETAKQLKVTPFSILYSALVVLLSRYSGEKDVLVGTVSANREKEALNHLIGFFVNNLALRTHLPEKISFKALIQSSHQNLLSDFEHQSLPFEQATKLLKLSAKQLKQPLFQIMMVLEHASNKEFEFEKTQVTPLSIKHKEARFDISLGVRIHPNKVEFNWNYALDLFTRETIEGFAKQLSHLVELSIRSLDEDVFKPALLTTSMKMSEHDQSNVNSAGHSSLDIIPNTSLLDLFQQKVKTHGSDPAISYQGETLSYDELEARSNQLANALIDKGICLGDSQGDIIAICLERSLNMIVSMLAVIKTGAAYLPIDTKTPANRLSFILNDSDSRLLICDNTELSSLCDKADFLYLPEFDVSTYSEYIPDLSSEIHPKSAIKPTATDLAYIIYTSGSTGQPKGVQLEHKGVVNYVKAQSAYLKLDKPKVDGLKAPSRFLYLTNFAFDTSVGSIWGALTSGHHLEIVSEEDRFNLAKLKRFLCQGDKYLVAYIPPILLDKLTPDDTSKLIPNIIVSGESVSQSVVDKYVEHTCLINEYGPTENSVCSSFHIYQAGDDANTIGQCINGVNAYVLDSFFNPVPQGVTGELYLSGVGLARGYLNQDELNQVSFIDTHFGRLYKTGDLVKTNKNAQLVFVSRIDEQIKIRGFRVELGEIEAEIQKVEGVKTAKVVLVENQGTKQLGAYVLTYQDDPQLLLAIYESLAFSLPDYMLPKLWAKTSSWPLNANGKLDKAALPKLSHLQFSQQLSQQYSENDLTAQEQTLLNLWQDMLKLESIGLNDNFFALGGDSILAMQLVARAVELGLHFSTKNLFEYPSIASLIPHIKNSNSLEAEQGASLGKQALLPIQHEFFHFAANKSNQFDQYYLFDVDQHFSLETMRRCFDILVNRHDALRLSFDNNQAAYHVEKDLNSACYETYMSKMDNESLNKVCNQINHSLDIAKGSVFKLVRLYCDNQTKLFILSHHLVIDAVSWQILISDFVKLYQAKIPSHNLLAAKTLSYQDWGKLLNHKVTMEYFEKHEANYWAKVSNQIKQIPKTHIRSNQTERPQIAIDQFELNLNDTQDLLNKANKAYHTDTQTLLITAISLTLAKMQKEDEKRPVSFTLESHGREGLSTGLVKQLMSHGLLKAEPDLSQTMGWFSATFPLLIEVDAQKQKALETSDLGAVICRVKESFKQVPNKGIGYGVLNWLGEKPKQAIIETDVLFNFFGQTHSDQEGFNENSAMKGITPHKVTLEDGAYNHMTPQKMAINARVSDGVLCFELAYQTGIYSDNDIRQFKAGVYGYLIRIIEHNLEQKSVRYTPSDFPVVNLTQEDLDIWQKRISKEEANLVNVYPLTGMQAGLLYQNQLESDAYITQLDLHYHELDIEIFKLAWYQLIQRHDIFRTGFMTTTAGDKYQVVINKTPLDWRTLDLSHLKAIDYTARFKSVQAEDKTRGFNHEEPCLMRFSLIKTALGDYHLIWTNHHALIDGWCLPILLSELNHIYHALKNETAITLKEAPSYQNFVKWLDEQDVQTANEFWQSKLQAIADYKPLSTRPISSRSLSSKPHDLTQSEKAKAIKSQCYLNSGQTSDLKVLAQEAQCTLNSLFQAAWGLLLSNYTDSNDIVFGSIVSGRHSQVHDIEKMVGLCINTLPVVMSLDKNADIKTWLKQLHREHVEAESFTYLPLQDIWKQTVTGNQAMFDSLLVFENYPLDQGLKSTKNGLTLAGLKSEEQTNYPLTIVIVEEGEIEIKLLSNDQHLAQWQVDQILNHFKTLLVHMSQANKLNDVKMLIHEDKHKQVTPCEETNQKLDKRSLIECFEAIVQSSPFNTAISFNQIKLSYQTLNEKANTLAHYLIAKGAKSGDNIGIHTERSIEMVVAMLAVMKLRATYVPMDTSYPASRLTHMIESASISHIICDQDTTNIQSDIELTFVAFPHLPSGLSKENVDKTQLDKFDVKNKTIPAYLMFTSGSTGLPKGTMIPESGIKRLVKQTNYVELNQDKKIAQISNFSFDAATFEIWGALLNGAQLVILPNEVIKNAQALSNKIESENIDIMFMTTALVNQMISINPKIFAGLDTLLFGGEKVNKQTINHMLDSGKPKHLVHVYGPTENTTFSTFHEIKEKADEYPIGKPISNTSTYILSKSLDLTPFGQVGELYLGGQGLALGYLNQAALTHTKFIESPFDQSQILYRTGDLVRYLANGDIEFVARLDDQIKLRGFRIERLEVLSQLMTIDLISKASIELIEREKEPVLAAVFTSLHVIETQAEKDEALATVKAELRLKLPSYMLPSEFHLYDELPLTQNGKLDRKKIVERLKTQKANKQVNTASPRDEIEMALYQIWLDILTTKDISITDNFFDIGGTSISAIKLIHKIEQVWPIKLSVSELLKAPSIEALGGIIRQNQGSDIEAVRNELIEFRKGEGELNVICPHLGGGTAFGYLSLAKVLPDEFGVYGIQAKGVDTDGVFLPDVQAMAEYYLTLVSHLTSKPHVFVGCSYGGYIAYEMARILNAAGHKSVAILLDSEGTHDQAVLDQISPVSLDVFKQKLVTYNGMYPHIDDAQIDRYFRIYNHHLLSLKTMSLAKSEARTITVIATGDKSDAYIDSLTAFWAGKAEADFQLELVDGDHSTMLQAPSILKVADIIKTELT